MSGIAFAQDKCAPHAGPGHWNDPDMLVVGKVGWGPSLHETKLTKNEQITHISLWCLQAAPLLIGCDMTNMDQFTLDVLSNDEVLDVDQDPLGKAALPKFKNSAVEVWARPLFDGTLAVGLFNRSRQTQEVTASWSDLGLSGKQPVRDLWQQKDLGSFADEFKTKVPRHGAVLVKIGTPKEEK
jgi:alpha-galactosidase